MGKISSSIGLVTGVPIQETVDKLIALSAQPRDQLKARTETLGKQQTAVTELMAKLVALQFTGQKFASDSLFQQKSVASSNSSLLSATVTGNPLAGRYVYTPVRPATTQQLVSSAFASDSTPLGAGSFSFQYGGELDRGVNLALLGGGQGVNRGKIRITDRSGASAEIDLSFATTVDDVLAAVNDATEINVTLAAEGDRFVLYDNTGQTAANLRVQEIGTGTTAADLGLAGIDSAADEATGGDVLRLYESVPLSELLDGRGVGTNTALPDLQVTFRDGSDALAIDFSALARSAGKASGTRIAANGTTAQLRFTAKNAGADYDGYTISFVDHASVTAGNELVEYDTDAKTITFYVDEGATTANDVIAALAADSEASADFTATAISSGTGLVSTTDGAYTSGGAEYDARTEATLGDLLETINTLGHGRLKAELRPDGDGIQLTDLTEDRGGTFAVTSTFDSPALEALGLTGTPAGGVLTGERMLAGLKTSLVSSLNGGQGLELGALELTDRSGATVSVDLSAAKTVETLIDTINTAAAGAGVAITAAVNSARTGLVLSDSSGATAGPLIVASGDATETAEQLGLATNANVTSIESGSLRRQTVTSNTLLASLNGGSGIYQGQFRITNAAGAGTTIAINSSIQTVGDLVKDINTRATNIEARINEAGDGIVLIDKSSGDGKLTVSEISGGRAAADLHLLGTATEKEVDGTTRQVIEGGNRFDVTLDEDDTLDDLITKINGSGAGLTALKLGDGSVGNPYRLSLFGSRAGEQANLLFDTSGVEFSFDNTVEARDALLLFGSVAHAGSGVLLSSKTNTFGNVLPGVEIQVHGASADPVVLEVKATDEKFVAAANDFVTAFNEVTKKLDELTFFNPDDNTIGILHGSNETLRVETELANLLTGRFFGTGSLQSLDALGISMNDAGKLALDESKLKAAFAADPEATAELFTKEEFGVAAKLDKLLDQLAGENNSLLVSRSTTLGTRIEANNERIEFLNERLERQREKLLLDFYRMELAVAKLQDNMTALNSIQVLAPMASAAQ